MKMNNKKQDGLTFFDFLEKHKKAVFLIMLLIAALIIGAVTSSFYGGLAGLFGALWGFVTGKKDSCTRVVEHEEEIQLIDRKIIEIREEQEKVIKTMAATKEEEKRIREHIKKIKQTYRQMPLSELIDEHNKLSGY